ncbi:sugar efflux transporter [Luedemannella flava]|uniref:Sugar efflux transporter n=1 Tax=Luedemannella flava TaxID=349316 RepID=A0ABP4YUV4_9ACTN
MTAPGTVPAGASPGQLVRQLAPLGYVATLVGLATSFVSPFLPLFLSRELHAGPARVALFLFLMPLAAVGVATVVGRLSDRPGARPRLLVLGAATGIVGYALFAIFRNYWAALAVALSLVAIAGSLLPQVFAFSRGLLDRVNPARAAAGINALRAVFSLSWVAGPPLAAYLIGVVDFRGLFLVAALMHVAILPVFLRFGAKAGARRQAAPAAVVDLAPPPRSRLLRISAAFILMQTAGSLGVTSMSLFVSEDLHRQVSDAGLVLGLCAAIEIPLMLLFGALAARWSLRRLVLLGAATGVGYFAAMAAASGLWQVAAAQVLNACFIAAVGGLGISYFQDLMPGLPGRATTMFTNAQRLSAMLAGLVFGVVQIAGYRSAYLIGVGLCASGLLLLAAERARRAA